jgi:hypothetical protein
MDTVMLERARDNPVNGYSSPLNATNGTETHFTMFVHALGSYYGMLHKNTLVVKDDDRH